MIPSIEWLENLCPLKLKLFHVGLKLANIQELFLVLSCILLEVSLIWRLFFFLEDSTFHLGITLWLGVYLSRLLSR